MKRRRVAVLSALALCLLLGGMAVLWAMWTPPEDPRAAFRMTEPPVTWWDRVQEQCRQLTGWPPAPALPSPRYSRNPPQYIPPADPAKKSADPD